MDNMEQYQSYTEQTAETQQEFAPGFSTLQSGSLEESVAAAVDGIDVVGGIDTVTGYGLYPYETYTYAYEQNYADMGYPMLTNEEQLAAFLQERANKRWKAPPLLILALMLLCFPVGLFMMLFFTRWGAYPKILITLFVLAAALAIYEILVAKNVIALPSVIAAIGELWRELFS